MSSPLKRKIKRPICHKCTKIRGHKLYLVYKNNYGIICPNCGKLFATESQLLAAQGIESFKYRTYYNAINAERIGKENGEN